MIRIKSIKSIICLLLLSALLLLAACGGGADSSAMESGSESSGSTGEEKQPAPDFTVYDEAGREYRLSDFRGKGTVLNFWASWCGPCKNEMPDFDVIYKELGDKYNFVMVNLTDGKTETVETASAFIKEQGYSFPVYYDTSGAAGAAFSVYSIPTTYFIDAEGNVLAYASGTLSGETLRDGIEQFFD